MCEPECPDSFISQNSTQTPDPNTDDDDSSNEYEHPKSQVGPTNDGGVGHEHRSDSSSEESSADNQMECERKYLRDQLQIIVDYLEANIPCFPPGPGLPPPWDEEETLDVLRNWAVADMKNFSKLGAAEGITEAEKGLVLQAMRLCKEQCCANWRGGEDCWVCRIQNPLPPKNGVSLCEMNLSSFSSTLTTLCTQDSDLTTEPICREYEEDLRSVFAKIQDTIETLVVHGERRAAQRWPGSNPRPLQTWLRGRSKKAVRTKAT